MKWTWLYSVFFVLLGVFFGSVILNQNNTFALSPISRTVHADDILSNSTQGLMGQTCDDYTTTSSIEKYLVIDSSINSSYLSQELQLYPVISNISTRVRLYVYSSNKIIIDMTDWNIYSADGGGGCIPLYSNFTVRQDMTFTLTDTISSGIIPSGSISITENGTYDVTNYAEAVVDVPTSSGGDGDNNYHEDLVAINNSILICGAICLVIYFFYCIYRMIIKTTGGV